MNPVSEDPGTVQSRRPENLVVARPCSSLLTVVFGWHADQTRLRRDFTPRFTRQDPCTGDADWILNRKHLEATVLRSLHDVQVPRAIRRSAIQRLECLVNLRTAQFHDLVLYPRTALALNLYQGLCCNFGPWRLVT